MKQRILLRAPILTQSGYGFHSRVIFRALMQNDGMFDVFLDALNWGKTSWIYEDNEERNLIHQLLIKTQDFIQNKGQFDKTIQCTIPNEFEKLSPYNIGVTAGCETTKIPPQWIEKCMLMDKIIVPSEFTKEVFQNSSYEAVNQATGEHISDFRVETPVEVIHHPFLDVEAIESDLDFGCENNFLIVALFGPRKNLDNTIRWFLEEFQHNSDVGLILKTSLVGNCEDDKYHTQRRINKILNDFPNRQCKVHLIHGRLSTEEMYGLYTHPQVKFLVNAAHGEGFNLPALEAAVNGLPIITIGWGGHNDFLFVDKKALFTKITYDLKPLQPEAVWPGVLQEGSMWAFPHAANFRKKLRSGLKNYGSAQSKAKKLKKHTRENFTEEKILQQYIDAFGGKQQQEVTSWFDQLNADIEEHE